MTPPQAELRPGSVDAPDVYTELFSIKGLIQSENNNQDIVVSLTGGSFDTYTTTAAGYYQFLSLRPESAYTVTPQRADLKFEPSSISTAALSANVTYWNFTGTVKRYSISGYVTFDDNVAIVGTSGVDMSSVTVTLSGSSAGTYVTAVSSNGYYQFTGLPIFGNYTVTPGKTGYVFFPASISVASIESDLSSKNFDAAFQPYYIKGRVKGAPAGLA